MVITFATAVTASMVDVGVTVYAFAKGEVSAEETAVRIGENGCSTLSGFYVGAAAGAVFDPTAAVVGSMAGYLLAATVYQSCGAVHREARLAEEEAAWLKALCAEAIRVLDAGRLELNRRLQTYLQKRDEAAEACFTQFEAGLASSQPESAIEGLTALTALCGARAQFASFTEFDAFMVESDEPLRLEDPKGLPCSKRMTGRTVMLPGVSAIDITAGLQDAAARAPPQAGRGVA